MEKRINWTRDEYILALELYLKYPKSAPSKSDPILSEYSHLMRSMHPIEASSDPAFRNENGVYLRLMNYRAVDPYWTSQGKVGMTSGKAGKCREIWEEFEDSPDLVFVLADEIKSEISYESRKANGLFSQELEEKGIQEGKRIMTRHFRRERSPSLRKKKLKEQFNIRGFNHCEACNQDGAIYRCESERILEVHHTVPLQNSESIVETKLSDLTILCANCHKAIHAEGSPSNFQDIFQVSIEKH